MYAKTKTQISCAVTAQLISAFVFATQIVQYLFLLNQDFKPFAYFCDCKALFRSDLMGNPEDWFSCGVIRDVQIRSGMYFLNRKCFVSLN